ncbi:AraC-type DNA-binding protein [Luteibacter sp. UNCMF331Sha3.1]|nr:AraC-type DNA-binding protein [Luteibacter sp. UNCMF331Sha3.1]
MEAAPSVNARVDDDLLTPVPPTPSDLRRARQLLLETLDDIGRDPALVRSRILRAAAILGVHDAIRRNRTPPPLLPPRARTAIITFIRTHLEKTLTLNEIARVAGLSTSYLSRAFKATFGVPTHAYIKRLRVERAIDLIRHTDTPLCEVALMCGFCDQSHMSNVFRRLFGDTPSRCRQGHFTPALPAMPLLVEVDVPPRR